MRTAGIGAALMCALLGTGAALGQGSDDATDRLRACSLMGQAERLTCLNKLAADIGSPPAGAATPSTAGQPASNNNWIVSETTSPVDYSPVVVATAWSNSVPGGAALKLAIQCRGGRTELVFSSPSLTRRAEDYALSYVLADRPPVKLAAGQAASGPGIAVKGDVVRLLASLPDRDEIAVRIADPNGSAIDGRYRLEGLKVVRDRLAVPCRWQAAGATPRN